MRPHSRSWRTLRIITTLVLAALLWASGHGLLVPVPGLGSEAPGTRPAVQEPSRHGASDLAQPRRGPVGGRIPRPVFAGLDLPVSPVAGPRCLGPERAGCFRHDRDGAALAAVHLLVRTLPLAGPDVFTGTVREQVTGHDAGDLLRLSGRAYDWILRPTSGVPDGAPVPVPGGRVLGYRVGDVEGTSGEAGAEEVTVQVVIDRPRVADGVAGSGLAPGSTAFTVRLAWLDDDWRLVAPRWGDWRTASGPATADLLDRIVPYDADPS